MIKRIGDFQVHMNILLGKGSFGQVYLGSNFMTGDTCAVKCIQAKEIKKEELDRVLQEINIMKQVKHENVVQLISFLQTSNNYYLILEYCNDGTLDQYIKKKNDQNLIKSLPEAEAWVIFQQLIEGLKALYNQKVIHRDIKPQNILIHQGLVKLGDLGFAKIIECEMEMIRNQTYAGSPLYMSPQIIKKAPYSQKCDIWSLGVVFFEILYGYQPFQAKSIPELLKMIESNKLYFPEKPYVSQSTKDLIALMLRVEESNRISMEQLYIYKMERIKRESQQLDPTVQPIIPMKYQSQIKQNDSISSNQTTLTTISNKTRAGIFEVNQQQISPLKGEERFQRQVFLLKNNYKIQKFQEWIIRKKNKVPLLNNLITIIFQLDVDNIIKEIPSYYYKICMFAFSQYQYNINISAIECLATKTIKKQLQYLINNNKKITQDMLDLYFQVYVDDFYLHEFKKQYSQLETFYKNLLDFIHYIKNKQIDDQRLYNIIQVLNQKPNNKGLKQVIVSICNILIEKMSDYINRFGLNSYKNIFQLIYYLDMFRKNGGQILKQQNKYLDFFQQEHIAKHESEEYVLKLYNLKQ